MSDSTQKGELEVEDPGLTDVVKVPVRLWSVVYSVLTTCLLALLIGATLSFSSPVLVELTQLEDPEFSFNTQLSDVFGVRTSVLSLSIGRPPTLINGG